VGSKVRVEENWAWEKCGFQVATCERNFRRRKSAKLRGAYREERRRGGAKVSNHRLDSEKTKTPRNLNSQRYWEIQKGKLLDKGGGLVKRGRETDARQCGDEGRASAGAGCGGGGDMGVLSFVGVSPLFRPSFTGGETRIADGNNRDTKTWRIQKRH